ncbi:MAG TPA: alanine racemase, partial [bacterium]|nr:alanine racemase [bacterium]
MEPTTARHQWIELSRSAYAHNILFFRRLLGTRAALAVVVKANGYGHGLLETAGLAQENGVGMLCVHTLDEAQKLKASGFTGPILLLGPVPIARSEEAALCGAALVAYDEEQVAALERAAAATGRKVDIHLKVETGTHRQGVMPERLGALLDLLKRSPHLRLAALYSHFANIEDTTDPSFALGQLRRFREACAAVE